MQWNLFYENILILTKFIKFDLYISNTEYFNTSVIQDFFHKRKYKDIIMFFYNQYQVIWLNKDILFF
jgi:hypothetical protein